MPTQSVIPLGTTALVKGYYFNLDAGGSRIAIKNIPAASNTTGDGASGPTWIGLVNKTGPTNIQGWSVDLANATGAKSKAIIKY